MHSATLFSISLLILSRAHRNLARIHHAFPHEVLDAGQQQLKRDLVLQTINYTITEQCPIPTATRSPILSLVWPSPEASVVEVTSQSQVVTSFIPEMTWCVGPPIAFLPLTGPPWRNETTGYSPIIGGTGSCQTVYAPTTTTVCATTLTGIASKITVTDCDQEITFSTECGFTLHTPSPVWLNDTMVTPRPTVQKMLTYWLAPWQSLTAGETPSDVDMKICTEQADGTLECLRYQEIWEVVVVTSTFSTTREVQLITTVTGPGTLIIETMQVFITDTIETVDLSTTILLETEVETKSTKKDKKLVSWSGGDDVTDAIVTKSTVYITKYLKYKVTSVPEPTTTIRVTAVTTERVGTITRTRHRLRPS